MELREPETVRMFNDHDGGIRYINPDFYHRGCDEDLDFVLTETVHDASAGFALHSAVHLCDFQIMEWAIFKMSSVLLNEFEVAVERFINRRENDVRLFTLSESFCNIVVNRLPLVFADDFGDDGSSSRWEFINGGDIKVAEHRESHRSGDGGGGHDECVGRPVMRGVGRGNGGGNGGGNGEVVGEWEGAVVVGSGIFVDI